MSSSIYVVQCVGQKLDRPARARDLYCSDWFRKARTYVESTGAPWFILSAKHLLLCPDDVVEPYNLSLKMLFPHERERWDHQIVWLVGRMMKRLGASKVVALAGEDYRAPLLQHFPVEVPMAGLGIGQQKAWLAANTPAAVAV